MKLKKLFLFLAVVLFSFQLFAQQDADGSKDHPMLSRITNFYIASYEENYDVVEFTLGPEDFKTLEGNKTQFTYVFNDEKGNYPGTLQVIRNYNNAVKKIGGVIVFQSTNEGISTYKLTKNSKEIWVRLNVYNSGAQYDLVILEVESMIEEVTADDILDALNNDGFIALYINFDTGKSDLKADSEGIIKQIVTLLKENPNLKISIEGHTDNIGNAESNKTLSLKRAEAVKNAVIKQGIPASRIIHKGWGQEKPIADNRTEDGRSKNRRVEIVKLQI